MAGKFLPMDQAAEQLNITPARLKELMDEGALRGFRDGTSWKFPESEIERLREEGLNVLDDGPLEGSSILVRENEVGSAAGKSGSIIGGDRVKDKSKEGSDVDLSGSADPEGSGLMLLADDESGVKLVSTSQTPGPVPKAPPKYDDDDDLLKLADEEIPPTKPQIKLPLQSKSALSDIDLGKDSGSSLNLGSGSHVLGSPKTPSSVIDDSDLAIADDDDLVLGSGGSDLAIAGDSGLNLMSPSDSGLSLEAEPLDLAGSSISALDLGTDTGGSNKSGSSGSLVDFRADEEFNLSPSGIDIATDQDSGSEVIEVEDSVEGFDAEGVEAATAGFEAFDAAPSDQLGEEAGMEVVEDTMVMDREGVGMVPAFEHPFGIFEVSMLLLVLIPLCLGGMIVTDLVRNIADYEGITPQVSSLTNALLGLFGFNK
jgi:excisionase family DNA binding protein